MKFPAFVPRSLGEVGSVPKLFAFLLTLTSLFLFFKPVAFAQATAQTPQTQQNQPYMSAETNPDVPKNLNTWTQLQALIQPILINRA